MGDRKFHVTKCLVKRGGPEGKCGRVAVVASSSCIPNQPVEFCVEWRYECNNECLGKRYVECGLQCLVEWCVSVQWSVKWIGNGHSASEGQSVGGECERRQVFSSDFASSSRVFKWKEGFYVCIIG